jgi:hypothetical protein
MRQFLITLVTLSAPLLFAGCSDRIVLGDAPDSGHGGELGNADEDAAPGPTPDAGGPDVTAADAGGPDGSPDPDNPCGAQGECASLPPNAPTACTPLGTVHVHLTVPSNEAGAYDVTPYLWAADPANWFSVSTVDGGALQIIPPTSDAPQALYWAPSCSACTSLAITPLQVNAVVGDAGVSGTWSGTTYSTTATCNQPQNGAVPCGDVLCSPAGKYVVAMCASPPAGAAQHCVSAPFDFPGTADVSGTLGP